MTFGQRAELNQYSPSGTQGYLAAFSLSKTEVQDGFLISFRRETNVSADQVLEM